MNKSIIKNGIIITPFRILKNHSIVIEDSKIKDIVSDNSLTGTPDYTVIDVKGKYIAPGFIDIHLHGGGGTDLMDGTEEAIKNIADMHVKYGTTAMVPSTLCCPLKNLLEVMEVFRYTKKYDKGSKLLGLHLEGPYFSMEQRGAQDPRYIKTPDITEIEQILQYSEDIVRFSAAPELEGALELGRRLSNMGILMSVGHSDATYDDILKAVEAGYSHMTHIYSGMSGVRRVNAYRVAGVVEAGYIIDELTVEVIADGSHLPPALLK